MQDAPKDRASDAGARAAEGDLRAFYTQLDRMVAALLAAHPGSACRACGSCCTFPEGVPVLYASVLEHAYLASTPPQASCLLTEKTCPHFARATNHCAARERRPAVCRAHFCDEAMADRGARIAMDALYEWAQDEVRRISDVHGVQWKFVSVCEGE